MSARRLHAKEIPRCTGRRSLIQAGSALRTHSSEEDRIITGGPGHEKPGKTLARACKHARLLTLQTLHIHTQAELRV